MHDLARTRLEPGGAVGDAGEGVRWQDEQVKCRQHHYHYHHHSHHNILIINLINVTIISMHHCRYTRLEWPEERQVRQAFTCWDLECLTDQRCLIR